MEALICDGCGKAEALTPHGDWLKIERLCGSLLGRECGPWHFCGWVCLISKGDGVFRGRRS